MADRAGGCALPPLTPGLQLESLPTQGIFRISNATRRRIDLYYTRQSSFGDYQMFMIRFRDRSGAILNNVDQTCGWWTPTIYSSQLEFLDRPPTIPRVKLTIPAGGSIEIRQNFQALTSWLRLDPSLPNGPCEMQILLTGYPSRRTFWRGGAISEWQPSLCPSATFSLP
jgi:hypothetical protein